MRLSSATRFIRCDHSRCYRHYNTREVIQSVCLPLVLSLLLWSGSSWVICSPALAFTVAQDVTASVTESPLVVAQAGAVSITSAEDAVAKFTPSQQLYIKGNPLTAEQVDRLRVTLNANPNVFVVLMDDSTDVFADDETLSRGIANTSGFESIRHPTTGERQGILFMVYFDSDQGRMIFMRSEELPDRLGVGEENFADASGNPRQLLNMFVSAVRDEGKDVPGALEVVINHINGTIQQRLEAEAETAQQSIDQANAALTALSSNLEQFNAEFPNAGAWARPDVAAWQTQLQQAQTALDQSNVTEAESQSQSVIQAIRNQETLMHQYWQAVAIAPDLQTTLNDVATLIESLPDQATTALNPFYTQAQNDLQAYYAQIQAGQPEFWTAFQTAQESIEALQWKTQQVRRQLARRQILIGLVIGVLAMALLACLSILWVSAKSVRVDAEKVLQKASRKLADRTQALLKLLEDAEYHSFKTYTGATATHAKRMLNQITDALVLMGGAEVVLAEAETLVQYRGVVNRFWSGNFRRAIALLTDANTALPLQEIGNLQAVLKNQDTSIKNVWRSHLSTQTTTDSMNHSFQNILEQMAERRKTAVDLLQELVEKDSGIDEYLSQVEADIQGIQAQAKALPSVGESQLASDSWFTVPSLLTMIAPLLLGDQGYIAQGRRIMTTDPINAWEHYGDGAKRMAQESATAVDIANEGRSQLLTILAQGDRALHPVHVRTDWAHDLMQDLSQRLDQTVQDSAQSSVADTLEQLRQEMQQLGDRIQTIVRQDNERRTVAPEQIQAATHDVDTARQRLCHRLQSLELFQTGTPEGVLREPNRDPSTHIAIAQTHLDELKALLDVGDERRSQSHLETIAAETQTAHQLVADAQAAIDAYPQLRPTLQERIQSLHRHRQETTIPILEELQRTYAPEVLEWVAPEVKSGQTIVDNPSLATNLIHKATETLQSAVGHMNAAQILITADELATVDRLLTSANTQLENVAVARQVLAQKQQSVLAKHNALSGQVQQTARNLQAMFVRSTTRSLGDELRDELTHAAQIIRQSPLNPYASQTKLQGVETLRQRVETAIAADQKAFNTANTKIRRAESAISGARNDINRANSQHFRYATVHTHRAEQSLQDAESSLSQARRSLTSQQYESSISQAQTAIDAAQRASREADNAVSRARREHSAEQRRREAAARRARSSSSSSSFSSRSSSSSSRSSSSRRSSSSSSNRSSSSGSRGGSW